MVHILFQNNLMECGCKWFYLILASSAIVLILLITHEDPNRPHVADPTLLKVVIFFRHGSRSPIAAYPTDKYVGEEFWPDGYSQLTKKGKREMYQLGKKLKRRYWSLVPVYRESRVAAWTTRATRTHISCQLVLAGMFPGTGAQAWSRDLHWQPIPVWTTPVKYVKAGKHVCPRYHQIMDRLLSEDKERVRAAPQEDPVMVVLRNQTGIPITSHCSYYIIWDSFNCQVAQGYKLPVWAKSIFPEEFTRVVTICYKIHGLLDPVQLQLGAAPWLQEVSSVMSSNSSQALHLYSAHDFILNFLLEPLREPFKIPHPGAALAIELHLIASHHILKFYYYEDVDTVEPQLLDLPECRNPCHLSQFSEFVNQYSPPDYEKACLPL